MPPVSFVCFSINTWEKRKARKQQFMAHLARRDDVAHVLYVEPPLALWRLILLPFSELRTSEDRARWKRALLCRQLSLTQKLTVCTPLFIMPFAFHVRSIYSFNLRRMHRNVRQVMERRGIRRYVLWLYHPFDGELLDLMRDRICSVFDWAEEWSKYFNEYSPSRLEQIRQMEHRLISRVDAVFVVSSDMLEKARTLNPRARHLLDGTVHEQFRPLPGRPLPADIASLPAPRIGYIGTVGNRVDIGLLERIADTFPAVSLVIIGDVHRDRADVSSLRTRGNVHFLGGKEYADLGPYATALAVCILPYKPAVTQTFPTKLYDYFAIGCPVVSTDLVEVQRYRDLISITRTPEEFLAAVTAALDGDTVQMRERRIATARDNSWEARVDEIMAFLKEGMGL